MAIGKGFEDVGLGVIVTESGIVGSGSVSAMLEGRFHTIAYKRKEGRAVIIRTDRNLFARFLVIGQSR